MYETPGALSDEIGGAGTAGAGAAAATAGSSGMSTSGAGAGATSGTAASTAGSGGAAGSLNNAGAAGEPVVEPGSGGEGGAPDVIDECPGDPDKVMPGKCGCGVPEPSPSTLADCDTLEGLLAHRYDFEGTGTAVKDRVGTAHGVIARGASLSKLDGKGVVLLGGGEIGPYVDLPNGLVSSLTDATIESWVTWGGGNNWQRIFDFGASDDPNPENNPASGKSYLFVTPSAGWGKAAVGYSPDGISQDVHASAAAPLKQSLSQVVVVADDAANKLVLYIDGAKAGEQAWTGKLSSINDVNVWLGRSQYLQDPELNAVFHDFRIYEAALSAAQVAASFNGGTDPAFLAD